MNESREKLKAARKEVFWKKPVRLDQEGDAIITLRAENEDAIYSDYDWDSSQKLNAEFSDYILSKAEDAPTKANFHIRLYSTSDIDEEELKWAIHSKFKNDSIKEKHELISNRKFALVMFIVGLLAIGLLFACYKWFYNAYTEVIFEIVAWVFMWEAVDAFFLESSRIRKRLKILLRLYISDVKVYKISKQEMKKVMKMEAKRQREDEEKIRAEIKAKQEKKNKKSKAKSLN